MKSSSEHLMPSCPIMDLANVVYNIAFYLDDSHVEAGLPGQLFPDVSRWLRCGRESRFQGLQLFGFDGGPRPASLTDGALLVVLVVARVLIG